MKFRIISTIIRGFSITSNACKLNHYDSLGITSKATQADIKTAYYKLSMVYHPDKTDNEENAQKFRDITEAYEVLGNVNSRKLYDRGLFMGNTAIRHEDTPVNKFYKSRDVRSRPPAPSGTRTTVYDFDEWSKAHYGKTFARNLRNKRQSNFEEEFKRERIDQSKSEHIVFAIVVLLLAVLYGIGTKDYDNGYRISPLVGTYVVDKKDD